MDSRPVVTCAFCAMSYSDGTVTARHDALTMHVLKCERHPMRLVEAKLKRLADASKNLIAFQEQFDILVDSVTTPTVEIAIEMSQRSDSMLQALKDALEDAIDVTLEDANKLSNHGSLSADV